MAKITQVVGARGASRRGRESPRYRRLQMLRRNEIPAHLCWAPSECSPRGITRRTRLTRGAIHARSIHSTSSGRASRPTRTSVHLQSTNAQTPRKTEEYQRPESKTIQQLAEPDEICKTFTPGSNPGGASNFLRKSNGPRLALAAIAFRFFAASANSVGRRMSACAGSGSRPA